MKNRNKTDHVSITIRNIDIKHWEVFKALCSAEESDASSQIRLYIRDCARKAGLSEQKTTS